MDTLKDIVEDAMGELKETLSAEQAEQVARAIERAIIRGVLEGQHRAVDACNECSEAERDTAHKIAAAIRRKNDALIVNLSSLR
ncbi:MAG: hypothetical protein JSU82_18215 [Rhodospirillales bacterium]|nr:MAG: hypothetical protein JSU82_18215 [Rhodospirillales bacterium]